MGRYSVLIAPQLADFAAVRAGQRMLDVGCGPGALTTELVSRLGADLVSAIDPSETFVSAARDRHPGVDVRLGSAEQLPFADQTFDGVLAQLVVHFMADPTEGLSEMVRVIRPGGVVAACVRDHAGGLGPLSLFWDATRELDPEVEDESQLAGAREGGLPRLFHAAGLGEIEETLAPGSESDGEAIVNALSEGVSPEKHQDSFAVLEQMDQSHPEYPHWYLPWLGVNRAMQGGLGGELLQRCLAMVDESHLPTYLETPNPRTVPLYERQGFRITDVAQAGACPPITLMLRAAQ